MAADADLEEENNDGSDGSEYDSEVTNYKHGFLLKCK